MAGLNIHGESKILGGLAYRIQKSNKAISRHAHEKGIGGYRDYTTTPVPEDKKKDIIVNKNKPKPNSRLGPQNKAPSGSRDDSTRHTSDPDAKDAIKTNDGSMTSNMRSVLIITGVIGAAALIYYIYRPAA